MKDKTRTGLEILQAAVLVGVLGNLLLRATPWGLNAFLFVVVFVGALGLLVWRHRPELITKTNVSLAGAMVFFASMYLIRDSEQLLVFDTFAIIGIMGVLMLGNLNIRQPIAGAFHYVAGFIWAGLTSVFGGFLLLGADIDWKSMPGGALSKTMFSILRGLAVALPLLLIFGGLFMAADAAYEGMIKSAFNFDIDEVVSHVLLTSVFAWLTAGYLRGATARYSAFYPRTGSESVTPNDKATQKENGRSYVQKVAAESGEQPTVLPNNASVLEHINAEDGGTEISTGNGSDRGTSETETVKKIRDWQNIDNSKLPSVFTLGPVETVIILGLVDLLFVSFVAFQLPYLFGGMELVQTTPDFKLADYARRGFGELVAVSALVLPMLLVSHWLLRREGKRLETLYRVLAGFQIVLLFVVMASAVQRLLILTGESGYGLTTVRFYPMVLMTWLAVVFIWFAVTVLRGARKHFAWGALWSAIAILGFTNIMDPDDFIARTNLALMHEGRDFDAGYNFSLSNDAIPGLMNSYTDLNEEDQLAAFRALAWKACRERGEHDVRTWNYSRQQSAAILAPYDEQFAAHTPQCGSD
jgi:hypothetical protein